jgi:hypothetical protein
MGSVKLKRARANNLAGLLVMRPSKDNWKVGLREFFLVVKSLSNSLKSSSNDASSASTLQR